uniref:Uncharacterized protein n=1 Tax=Hyaloperonospora arabidopsidis (strain Emoy2) TaxID=559515 RepID=M4BKK2_HYAAE
MRGMLVPVGVTAASTDLHLCGVVLSLILGSGSPKGYERRAFWRSRYSFTPVQSYIGAAGIPRDAL